MNQRPKALISARAKKFIPSQKFIINCYFKGTQQFTGCFPNHDWLCHPWPPFLHDPLNKRWPRVTKPIMVGGHSCQHPVVVHTCKRTTITRRPQLQSRCSEWKLHALTWAFWKEIVWSQGLVFWFLVFLLKIF